MAPLLFTSLLSSQSLTHVAGASAGWIAPVAGSATIQGHRGAVGAPGKSLVPFQTLQCSSVRITSTNYAFRELVPDATLYDFPRPFQALQCNLPMCSHHTSPPTACEVRSGATYSSY